MWTKRWVALALAFVLAACGYARASPMTIDTNRLRQPEPLTLQVGDQFTLVGYPAESIAVADETIVQPVSASFAGAEALTVQTTFQAMASGHTELMVSHSLCEGITSCSSPMLYWRLQVAVR
jgi:hypothetical protein